MDVTIDYTVTDPCPNTCVLTVSSHEPPVDDKEPEWIVVDAHHLQLRAERLGSGTGRVYTITFTCTNDTNKESSTKTVTVRHLPNWSLDNNALGPTPTSRGVRAIARPRVDRRRPEITHTGRCGRFGITSSGAVRLKGMRLDHLLLSPGVSERLVDGGVDGDALEATEIAIVNSVAGGHDRRPR